MEVIGNIYQTQNYGLFNYIKENREVDELNKDKIRKSIEETGQLCPVIVGEQYQILDGQHRFEVCKELGLPVKFIQISSSGIYDVYTMNNVSKKWTLLDSLGSGVKRVDENYIKVREVFDENDLNLPLIINDTY